MKPHVNHEDEVTVLKTHTLVLLVLAGAQLELLLYAAVASRNFATLQQPEVSRTHLSLLLRWSKITIPDDVVTVNSSSVQKV
jgi:hypothetical protein